MTAPLPIQHVTGSEMRSQTVGFIGLGVMGLPMAVNLLKSGTRLVVWNRTPGKCSGLEPSSTTVASSASAVFDAADVVLLMLANEAVMDEVLQRGTPEFASRIAGRTVISMGTTSPAYSQTLAAEISAMQGCYIECPVSGSRRQAEAGALVGMLAGEAAMLDRVRPLLATMLRESFVCGPVPSALLMKLAVNHFLITMVTGLCEAFHFANRRDLNLQLFQAILDASPMASSVSRIKLRKLVDGDDSVEASIIDVLKNNRLIADQARQAQIASPLLDVCHLLFEKAVELGLGKQDMTAVLKALQVQPTATENLPC